MNKNHWEAVLRTSVGLALAFAHSVGSAAAQHLPSQPPAAIYAYPADAPQYPSYPYSRSAVRPSQDDGTVIAALPPEYQPEAAQELSPQFRRTVVDYPTIEPPGTIIIDTPNTYLYLVIGHGKASYERMAGLVSAAGDD